MSRNLKTQRARVRRKVRRLLCVFNVLEKSVSAAAAYIADSQPSARV
jgi:hypothetical protein